jgi:hypothetical protein
VIKVRPASRHAKKLYDLLTAAPLIAWYLLGLSQLLPALEKQVALAKVFIQTDYSVIPATLALGIACKVCTLIFLAPLVVMFTVRRAPPYELGPASTGRPSPSGWDSPSSPALTTRTGWIVTLQIIEEIGFVLPNIQIYYY